VDAALRLTQPGKVSDKLAVHRGALSGKGLCYDDVPYRSFHCFIVVHLVSRKYVPSLGVLLGEPRPTLPSDLVRFSGEKPPFIERWEGKDLTQIGSCQVL